MIRAAVLGSPISHSRSPLLHNAAYKRLGIMGEYSSFEVDESGISIFLKNSHAEGWNGFSLTMPLKDIARSGDVEEMSGLTFHVDEIADSIGSINTLLPTDTGYRALSSDYLAFQRLLAPILNPESRVSILGGGGTARAAIGAVASSGAHSIELYLRGGEESRHASVIRGYFPHLTFTIKEFGSSLSGGQLLINTTPRGGADEYATMEVAQSYNVFFESLYNPWPTSLAGMFLKAGVRTLSGNDLLVEQALDQISLMTKIPFDYAEMRDFLLAL